MAEKVLVPLSPDGMQDPSPAPVHEGYLVTAPEDSQVDCMEAERRSLQDRDFSQAAIKMILATTRDTIAVYKGRWEGFVNRCSERGENPICTSLKHVLDFLQTKFETLAVNTIKGYVKGISCRHAMVHRSPLSMDPYT